MDNRQYEVVDDETGEIVISPDETQPIAGAEPEPQPARYEAEAPQSRYEAASEPTRGEILPPGHDRAADGAIMHTIAHTAGGFVDLLEDGAFSHEVQQQLRSVAEQMSAITNATGTKTKGQVTLTIDLTKEGEHFDIRAKVKAKAPELPRPKTVVWSDPATGNFTRFPPQQTQMFGMRPVRNVP